MAQRRYRRLRTSGQDAVPFTLPLASALGLGIDLLGGSSDLTNASNHELDLDQARAAWEAHRPHVLAAWQERWACFDFLPTPWAARVFDGTEQIPRPRPAADLNGWAREQIANIEREVSDARQRLKSQIDQG